MRNDRTALGKASLWASIAGLVVPVCLALLVAGWALMFVPQGRVGPSWDNLERILAALALCGALFVLLELVALGCGIAARGTGMGQTGLTISGVLLTLALALIVSVLYRSDFFKPWVSGPGR